MMVSFLALSLATPLFAVSSAALDIDVNNQDSIKGVAKTLVGGIVAKYNNDLEEERIPGLFSDPYYWWESGAILNSLIDYSHLTGDKQYDDLVAEGVLHQLSDNNFMPPNQSKSLGNEDQSYWAFTAMSAAENGFTTSKLGNQSWSAFAANVFDEQAQRWDSGSCGGGLKWQIFSFNVGYNYKNSASTGNFFLLASRLAKFTGNSTYSDWADKAFQWTQDVGFVTKDFEVFDGADDTNDCADINEIQWSSNLAIFTEAAAHMYNITNGNDKWKNAVTDFVNASTVFHKNNGILVEVACEDDGKCNNDQSAFKGVAARSFARATQSAPFISDTLTPILEASAKGAAESCSGEDTDLKCALEWTGNGNAVAVDKGLGEAFSALAVVQGLLVKDAKAPDTSSSNGSSSASPSASSSGSTPAASGSGQPEDKNNAAGALLVSRNLVVALAALATVVL